jgi:hypothetical protein
MVTINLGRAPASGRIVRWSPSRHPAESPWPGRVLQGPSSGRQAWGGGPPPFTAGAGTGPLVGFTLLQDDVAPCPWGGTPLFRGSVIQEGGSSIGFDILADGVYDLRAELLFSTAPPDALAQLIEIHQDWTWTVLGSSPVTPNTTVLATGVALPAGAWVATGLVAGPSSAVVLASGEFTVVGR